MTLHVVVHARVSKFRTSPIFRQTLLIGVFKNGNFSCWPEEWNPFNSSCLYIRDQTSDQISFFDCVLEQNKLLPFLMPLEVTFAHFPKKAGNWSPCQKCLSVFGFLAKATRLSVDSGPSGCGQSS